MRTRLLTYNWNLNHWTGKSETAKNQSISSKFIEISALQQTKWKKPQKRKRDRIGSFCSYTQDSNPEGYPSLTTPQKTQKTFELFLCIEEMLCDFLVRMLHTIFLKDTFVCTWKLERTSKVAHNWHNIFFQ